MAACIVRKAAAVRALAARGGYGETDPLVLLIDFDAFRERVASLRSAFPPHWRHAFAIKANPTRLVLAEGIRAGLGLEAASIGELRMAKRAGCDMAHVVYDSPLKSRRDIEEALAEGATLNVDNLQELEVVAETIARLPQQQQRNVGIRINSQVGAGALEGFSTGTATSKFGIGLHDAGGAPIFEAYKRYAWLNVVMCHVGSQGIAVDLAVNGVRAVVDFALRVNRAVGRNQIQHVDIGGGLSVNFASDAIAPSFEQYAAALRAAVPELFEPSQFSTVVTEFGRALIAKAGFFASRVEYVKETGGRRIAIQYAGADTCVRTVYHPKEWPLRVSILDGQLVERDACADAGVTDVAGPCCIQADIVAHQRMLPRMSRGDTVLLHDVGGYYHSGHTRYNLRQAPAVWVYEGPDDALQLRCVQRAETVDQTLDAFTEH